jgi:pimeloyl-CoA synthetase
VEESKLTAKRDLKETGFDEERADHGREQAAKRSRTRGASE